MMGFFRREPKKQHHRPLYRMPLGLGLHLPVYYAEDYGGLSWFHSVYSDWLENDPHRDFVTRLRRAGVYVQVIHRLEHHGLNDAIELAREVGAQEFVFDKYAEHTIEKFHRQSRFLHDIGMKVGKMLIGVTGSTDKTEQKVDYYRHWVSYWNPDVVVLDKSFDPGILTEDWMTDRLHHIHGIDNGRNVRDIQYLARLPWVRSMDLGAAVGIALESVILIPEAGYNYFDSSYPLDLQFEEDDFRSLEWTIKVFQRWSYGFDLP